MMQQRLLDDVEDVDVVCPVACSNRVIRAANDDGNLFSINYEGGQRSGLNSDFEQPSPGIDNTLYYTSSNNGKASIMVGAIEWDLRFICINH